MPATLAQLPAFEPARRGVPRCGYRPWAVRPLSLPRRPGMARCLAMVEFDYWPGGAAGPCLNIKGRLMADDEHGERWLSIDRDSAPVPVEVSEAACADFVEALVSAGFISHPASHVPPSPVQSGGGGFSHFPPGAVCRRAG